MVAIDPTMIKPAPINSNYTIPGPEAIAPTVSQTETRKGLIGTATNAIDKAAQAGTGLIGSVTATPITTVATTDGFTSTPSTYDPTKSGVFKYDSTVDHSSEVAKVDAPDAPQARAVTRVETVAGQLNDLLNENSTYMQSAKANASIAANSRGLINSSMAVGAAQKAAIDSAMPIATQDANTNSAAGLSAQNAGQDLTRTGYDARLQSALGREKFGYDVDINSQNIAANTYLQDKRTADDIAKLNMQIASTEGMAKADLIAKRNELQATLDQNRKLEDTRQSGENTRTGAQLSAQAELKKAEIQTELMKLDAQIASSEGIAKQQLQQKAEELKAQLKANADLENARQAGAIYADQVKAQLEKDLLQSKIDLDLTKLSSEETTNLGKNITSINDTIDRTIASIQTTPDSQWGSPELKAQAIAQQQQNRITEIETVTSLAGYQIGWTGYGDADTMVMTKDGQTAPSGLISSVQRNNQRGTKLPVDLTGVRAPLPTAAETSEWAATAQKIATGKLPYDPAYDTNGDGKVDTGDAVRISQGYNIRSKTAIGTSTPATIQLAADAAWGKAETSNWNGMRYISAESFASMPPEVQSKFKPTEVTYTANKSLQRKTGYVLK